ncbi:MAG: helix-turn-helix domain-containing protein [Solirubrobacterales bacterium]
MLQRPSNASLSARHWHNRQRGHTLVSVTDATRHADARKDEVDAALGRVLRKTRDAKGLTQSELGSRVRLSRASIANIERGDQGVSVALMRRLANALQVESRQFFAKIDREIAASEGRVEIAEELRRHGVNDEREARWIASAIQPGSRGDQ